MPKTPTNPTPNPKRDRLHHFVTITLCVLLLAHIAAGAVAYRICAETIRGRTWGSEDVWTKLPLGSYTVYWIFVPPALLLLVLAVLGWKWKKLVQSLSILSLAALIFVCWAGLESYRSHISFSLSHAWNSYQTGWPNPDTYEEFSIAAYFAHGGLKCDFQTMHKPRDVRIDPDVSATLWFSMNTSDKPSYPIIDGADTRLGLGFAYYDDITRLNGFQWHPRYVVIPCWFLILLFSLFPAIHLLQILRARKHRAKGLCKNCGYDLRASKTRCPECGTPFTTPAKPEAPLSNPSKIP